MLIYNYHYSIPSNRIALFFSEKQEVVKNNSLTNISVYKLHFMGQQILTEYIFKIIKIKYGFQFLFILAACNMLKYNVKTREIESHFIGTKNYPYCVMLGMIL